MNFVRAASATALALISLSASAADYPAPKEGDWVARDFRFHTGEIMPDCACIIGPLATRLGKRS
jgi:homoserine O-acetyltransferase/O-succinyltransferase